MNVPGLPLPGCPPDASDELAFGVLLEIPSISGVAEGRGV
jgi:hypothetical protein